MEAVRVETLGVVVIKIRKLFTGWIMFDPFRGHARRFDTWQEAWDDAWTFADRWSRCNSYDDWIDGIEDL